MTVTELLDRIIAIYPGASAEALASFKSVFHARLRKHEGAALAAAAGDVFAVFNATARKPFPIPVDFEQHLPTGKLDLPSEGPRLNFKDHAERYHALMANWRRDQRERAANGVEEIRRALEFVAVPIANMLAWQPGGGPLLLTRAKVRLAQHQAISQQRAREFGYLDSAGGPRTNDQWWQQIETVAARWGIAVSREEWGASTERQEGRAA